MVLINLHRDLTMLRTVCGLLFLRRQTVFIPLSRSSIFKPLAIPVKVSSLKGEARGGCFHSLQRSVYGKTQRELFAPLYKEEQFDEVYILIQTQAAVKFERKKVILITGASTGLGLSIAKSFLGTPFHLVLTARKQSLPRFEAEGIAPASDVWIRPLDVTIPEERILLMKEIEMSLGGVDILINNAGFAYRSVLEHVEHEELLQQMITNFWAPMELVRLALPQMRNRRSGHIINISSVGGMMAMPTMAVYSASKFALEGASEALYYELKPWNIAVTLVEPGFVRSQSFQNVRYTTLSGTSMRDPSEAYFGHYRFMTSFIEKIMSWAPGTTESIAKKIVKLIENKNPPLRLAATLDATFFDLLRRFLPRRFYHWFLYRSLPFPDCWGDEDRLRERCKIKRLK